MKPCKKLLLNLLFIPLSLLLVGCGSEEIKEEKFTVYFVTEENSWQKEYNKGALLDEEYSSEEYLFLGWFDETYVVSYSNQPVNEDLIVYAKTVKIGSGYNISYDLDGGEFETKQVKRYVVGEETTLPTLKKEPNFEFVGWDCNGTTITSIDKTTYGDLNLKAVFIDHNVYCKISYELNGGTMVGDPVNAYRVGDENYINQAYGKKEGYYFRGWYLEPDFKTVVTTIDATFKNDITLYAYYVEKKAENTLLSYFGDSITTYENCIPDGFISYYPVGGCDVDSKEDTWWYQLTQKLGYTLLMNNSFSGTMVTKGTIYPNDEWYGTNDKRIELCAKDGINPDIIIIHMGTNDFSHGVSVTSFTTAYKLMLDRLYYFYDDVEIYLCLHPYNKYGDKVVQIRLDYNEAIKKIANEYHLTYFDLTEVITKDNVQTMMCYNPHPSALGMKTMADYIYSKMTNKK